MATIAVAASANWDAITGKTSTGNDTFNISAGARLTIDTDVRYCENSALSFGPLNINATTGGEIFIDGSNVRLIPYNTGSGTVPAIGTTISQGGVSAYLLGVWASVGGPPTAPAAAMPAAGFIKVKNKTGGSFASGALTGIAAAATGADVVGWIQAVIRAATTITVPFIGKLNIKGDWFEAGTTNGARNQTIQLPYDSGSGRYAGVWVETSAGSGTYEHYPNAALITGATLPTSAARGKVVWISTAGVCRIGNDGTNAVGFLPATGCKVRVPNILFDAETAANVINGGYNGLASNAFTLNNANTVSAFNIWNANIAGTVSAYGGSLIDSGFTMPVVAVGEGNTYTRCMVSYVTGALLANTGTMLSVISTVSRLAAGTITDCTVFMGLRNTASAPCVLSGKATVTNLKVVHAGAIAANNPLGIGFSSPVNGLTLNNPTLIGGIVGGTAALNIYKNLTINNLNYASCFAGATGTFTQNALSFASSNADGILIDGFSLLAGETNVHPRTSVVSFDSGSNFDIRNIGTQATPINGGSANILTNLLTSAPANVGGVTKIRRCYTVALATGLFNIGTTGASSTYDNLVGDYADGQILGKPTGATFRSIQCTPTLTAQACSDNYFHSVFTAATTGQILLCFNNPVNVLVPVTTAGTPYFNGSGAVIMRKVGDQIEWTMPYYALGHTALANLAPTLTGGTATNYTLEFKINKNDGAGWSASWATLSAGNLSAVTGISSADGFALKIRITTTTANADTLTFLKVFTTTTSTDQLTLYPLTVSTVSVSGLVAGSQVKVVRNDTSAVIFNGAEAGGSISFTTSYLGAITVEARRASSSPYYVPWSAVGTVGTGISFTALQQLDE